MYEKPPAATQSPPLPKDELNLHDPPSSRVNSRDSSLSILCIPSSDTTNPTPFLTYSKPSYAPSKECPFSESDTPDEFGSPTTRERSTPEMNLVPFREESPKPHQPVVIPSFSLLPSLRLPSVPRQLHTSLSFLGSEHFQISDITSSGLDLKLCAFPFSGVAPRHRGS